MTILRIGRSRYAVASIAEASALYCRLRDNSGEGYSTWPVGRLSGHYISYNGKVWKGTKYVADATPVFDPYARRPIKRREFPA